MNLMTYPKRLHIVQVLDTLRVGGAERMALNLALMLMKAGHRVEFYCVSGEGELGLEARAAGIKVTNFKKQPGISVSTVLRISRALRKAKPHVVHTHNPAAHYYGAPAAFLARVPVVVNTRHSPISSRGVEHRERYFDSLMRFTDEVVFVSDHARATISAQWRTSNQPSRIIPNGIPVSRFARRPARPGSRLPGKIVFGTIGRLAPVKCHELLIRAFKVVSDDLSQAELRIVGGGPLDLVLRQQVEATGLKDKVSIEPPTDDVPRVLSGLDIFVISSISEGLPMVVLEAMAAGLPIVSTRVGGIPEVVPETVGWFCPAGDVACLAEAMMAAARSPDLGERGCHAALLASELYDASRMAAGYERLFWDCIVRQGYQISTQLSTDDGGLV